MVMDEFYFNDAQCVEFGQICGRFIFIKRLFAGHYLFQATSSDRTELVVREVTTMNNQFKCLEVYMEYIDFLSFYN